MLNENVLQILYTNHNTAYMTPSFPLHPSALTPSPIPSCIAFLSRDFIAPLSLSKL